METNIADKRVAKLAATTWKSRVSATMHCVRLRFGTSRLKTQLTSLAEKPWPADKPKIGRSHSNYPARQKEH